MMNPEQLAAQFRGKVEVEPIPPIQDLYEPGRNQRPTQQGQIPKGAPVVPGQFIQQIVGRGMAIVPPQEHQPNQPQISVIPPQQGARTSIGTFVETPPVVSAVKSNPLTQSQEELKVDAPPKRKPLDLAKEILTHIWELGGDKSEEAQKFYDRSPDALRKWQNNPASIPLDAINKFLARKPGIKEIILEELQVHFEATQSSVTSLPNRGKLDLFLCTPVLERMTVPYATMFGVLNKQYELGWTFEGDTVIHRSRNELAKRFLASNCTWSLWIDSDIAAPIGKADWYKNVVVPTQIPEEYLGYEVVSRLLSHSKAVVGGVYASRRWRGKLVIQPEIHPRSHEDKLLCNELRRGTARGLVGVDWIGFGCALVHREVFLEIQRRFPDLAPKQEFGAWRFFQPEADEGEDEAFCRRVRACSIPIWLDTQLICGHVGSMSFLPEHTQAISVL